MHERHGRVRGPDPELPQASARGQHYQVLPLLQATVGLLPLTFMETNGSRVQKGRQGIFQRCYFQQEEKLVQLNSGDTGIQEKLFY